MAEATSSNRADGLCSPARTQGPATARDLLRANAYFEFMARSDSPLRLGP